MNLSEPLSGDFIDAQYQKWKSDPASLSSDWHFFFKGFELAGASSPARPASDPHQVLRQARAERLIYRYRDIGHLMACMDPLSACPTSHPLLDLAAFELSPSDLDAPIIAPGPGMAGTVLLKTVLQRLKATYCRSIGVEYMHLQDPAERAWLQQRMEPTENQTRFSAPVRTQILERLIAATRFEAFLNKKYVGVTRFSLEGGETLIPLLEAILQKAHGAGCREAIFGMSHRGRLNVLYTILGKPAMEIFSDFESCYDPHAVVGAGDVKYHNGYFSSRDMGSDAPPLTLCLVSNPSHLEAVDPVVEGVVRARQDLVSADPEKTVMPVLLHGDAAFAGQGVVAETLNMSQLKGYRTGGTLHVVVNNQIGYTTLPEDARSTRYATDVAKGLMVPIFHVHGEDPEAVVHVARLAVDYRYQFKKDVVIDLICYRRYGHNEGDEPYFTQPGLYHRIQGRQPVSELYGDRLITEKVTDDITIQNMAAAVDGDLDAAHHTVRGGACPFPQVHFFPEWNQVSDAYSLDPVNTAVAADTLRHLAGRLAVVPDGFTVHPRLTGMLAKRHEAVQNGERIDWAGAEALAFATLLAEGHRVRLSGQDVGRGTFSQRHSVLWDYQTEDPYIPLNHLSPDQAFFAVHNSLLAETGVLGFEYGYAVTRPDALVLWEAQFGDFSNNAQSVIDLFIAAGETKWRQRCGIVLLLPHGWEGMGPEHSSARLERFLQLCASDNLQVANPTTPAQYFHLLRRQIHAPFRKPLVIMTPKSLLRHPMAVSSLADLSAGTFFPVLDEERTIPAEKVIFCSGKLYYQLAARREETGADAIALVRVEQLYPFPEKVVEAAIQRHAAASSWVWAQEEPENMGAWTFVRPRLEKLLKKPVAYVGRPASASPATGFPTIYKAEQDALIHAAVGLPE